MAPSNRSSSIKFEQAPDVSWREVEKGSSRRLSTEELNDLFTEARLEKEALVKEKVELKTEKRRTASSIDRNCQRKSAHWRRWRPAT
jgi:hypothetical protein